MNKTLKLTMLAATLTLALPLPIAMAQGRQRKKQNAPQRVESSAEVKKQQESTQQEIRRTREQIRLNEQEVKQKLNELSRLGTDIAAGKQKVDASQKEVNRLQSEITGLQNNIAAETRELERLRAEYLSAVKKMRLKNKQTSKLAFLFSSRNFNEAMRRMRYLRQFGDWRQRKSDEISGRVADLRKQTDLLAVKKTDHDKALAANVAAQNALQKQYAAQDAIVVELKKNGDALRDHLAKKQSEANALKNRVAALIAEEQRKAEAARKERERIEAQKRQEEERRLAEQRRIERERQAAEEKRIAEEKRLAEEKLLAEEKREAEGKRKAAEKKAAEQKRLAEQKKEADKKRKADEKKAAEQKRLAEQKHLAEQKKNSQKKNEQKRKGDEKTDLTYAEARGRKPRTQAPAETEKPSHSSAPASKSASSGASSFAAAKGSLPRPVSGAFRITSHFGSNPLPDMPNIMYDNPGIDVEVSRGATALAVYGGTVSGLYMVPGYGTVIILNHDGYYTVYGNIGQANVKVGDKVKQGQGLGRVADDVDNPGHGLIHFEVWKNREKQNPSAWIR